MTTPTSAQHIVNGSGGTALAQAQQRHRREYNRQQAIKCLTDIVQEDRLVGDLISMDYDTAEVLIHDAMKQAVGGVPHGCLLAATRMKPNTTPDLNDPSSRFILLRVLGSSKLPNDIEIQQKRLDAAKRASDSPVNYDEDNTTDILTLNQMRYAGAHCRIIGTFSMMPNLDTELWELVFGADIDNFYAGQGMKIYKLAGNGLEQVVNFTKGDNFDKPRVEIGRLRYSASADDPDAPESVAIRMTTADVLAKRTALFGMTRTGKSNTVKTLADAVFRLRLDPGVGNTRVPQLIIDPEGEYANENAQDQGSLRNLRNLDPSLAGDVVIHSLVERLDEPERRVMKMNFYGGNRWPQRQSAKAAFDQELQTLCMGKQIINDRLRQETGGYIAAFVSTDMTAPADVSEDGANTRYRRAVFVYRAILHAAGFPASSSDVRAKKLFSADIRSAMSADDSMASYAPLLEGESVLSWDTAADLCRDLSKWRAERTNSSYQRFNRKYQEKNEGRNWHDDRLDGLLRIFENTRGLQAIRECRGWHDTNQNQDYVQRIIDDLEEGRLVILDQALGDPVMNEQSAERIMWSIFLRQQESFIHPRRRPDGGFEPPQPIIVYVEEAHTLLPKGSDTDNTKVWSRTAKEGAKFNIGLVYSTQEPSSIQPNILTNTENWFMSYLNSTDETRQLDKYNDFLDFTASIRRTNEPGFVRVLTHSSPYTLPVQIHRFKAPPTPPENADLTDNGNPTSNRLI